MARFRYDVLLMSLFADYRPDTRLSNSISKRLKKPVKWELTEENHYVTMIGIPENRRSPVKTPRERQVMIMVWIMPAPRRGAGAAGLNSNLNRRFEESCAKAYSMPIIEDLRVPGGLHGQDNTGDQRKDPPG